MVREDLVTGRAQSGDREPAPADLRLVQDFVNTVDRENRVELFDGPEGLQDWLRYRDLPGEAGAAGLRRALELREALRDALLANNGGDDDAAAREALTAAARRFRLQPVVVPGGGVDLVPAATGVDAALGRVLAVALLAMADGRWSRLKACPREVCGWVFYDRSPANRSTWCAMRICGNRVKAGAYYRRTRGG